MSIQWHTLGPGQVVNDRWEILEEIGEGGMARVFKVRHTTLDTLHALKILDVGLVSNARMRGRFLAEGQIQARLKHPHIAQVTDIVALPGVAGLVLEFVDGPTLEQMISQMKHAPEPQFVREIFLPVLSALGYAHANSVIHRDIKPSNIVVARCPLGRPVPKLLDFGIAKLLGDTRAKTRSPTLPGATLGTPSYMSPEQVQSSALVDHRADIFSLGATLFEFATMSCPFNGANDFEIQNAVLNGPVPSARRAAPDIDSGIAACVTRALQKDPARRFSNCDDFARALRETGLEDGATVLRGGVPVPSSETSVNASAVRGSPSRVVRRPKPATRSEASAWRSAGFEEIVLRHGAPSTPSRRMGCVAIDAMARVAAVGGIDNDIRLIDLGGQRATRWLSGHRRPVRGLAFTADGHVLASGAKDNTVRVWDVESGRQVACLKGHEHWVGSVSLDRSGTQLASGSHDNTARVWDLLTSDELQRFNGHTAAVSSVALAPDGALLASASYDGTVRLWSTRTSRHVRTFSGHNGAVDSLAFHLETNRLLSTDRGGAVRVWDLRTARLVATLRNERGHQFCVAASPSGKTIATGDRLGRVWVWDLATQRPTASFVLSSGWVRSVSFAADGRTLVACDDLGRVRVWRLR